MNSGLCGAGKGQLTTQRKKIVKKKRTAERLSFFECYVKNFWLFYDHVLTT